jgi:hypothetical protein
LRFWFENIPSGNPDQVFEVHFENGFQAVIREGRVAKQVSF